MQALVTYHAQPGSDSEERLRLLASITTTDPGPDTPYGHDQPARTRKPRITSQRDGIRGWHCYADPRLRPVSRRARTRRTPEALRPRRAATDNQRQPNSDLE